MYCLTCGKYSYKNLVCSECSSKRQEKKVLKDIIHTLTDEQINKLGHRVCALAEEAYKDYVYNNDNEEVTDYCETCPFTKYCSNGKNGFVEFLKLEV